MIPEALDRAVRESINAGKTPFFAVATAGTTVLGAFDPIREIADITDRHDLWLHVDGAMGASVVLSEKHQHLMDGADKADSVAWNPHKTMGVPLSCSALLLKRKGGLEKCTSCDHGGYLFHEDDKSGSGQTSFATSSTESLDLGRMSLQCGRRVDALKLWLSWKYFGDKGYDERINKLFDLARYAGEKISSDSEMKLVSPVQSFNVCFSYDPGNLEDEELDTFNRDIRENMLQSGRSIVNYAKIFGRTSIRIAFINPDMSESDVDVFFDNVREAAGQLLQAA